MNLLLIALRMNSAPSDLWTVHAAMRAGGREPKDRAFEAVERMGLASRHDLQRFVEVIAARGAFSHGDHLFERLSVAAMIILSGGVAVCVFARVVR